MSVVCLSWETAHLHGEAWISHHRLRHRVFVEREGWDVPSYRGMEHDEFDTPSARYLLWVDEAGRSRAVVRLLPTTRPYMIQTLWPDMIGGEMPKSNSVWEATRLGCDSTLDGPTRRRAVAEILCAVQEFAVRNGIDRYLAVMPRCLMESVVMAAGYKVTRLGPERRLGNVVAGAASLAAGPDSLAEVRRRASIAGPVLYADMPVAA